MFEILVLGFFLGMSHALEPDHIAAVGAMTIKKGATRKSLFRSGVFWGSGHSLMLLMICGTVILLDLTLTDVAAAWLEFAVGGMLIALGIHVFYRVRQQSVHLHAHKHEGGKSHVHFHTHDTGHQLLMDHDHQAHEHSHPPFRMVAVGLMHGAAGSASLLALAVAMTHSAAEALVYVVLFGLGSVLGMGLLTMAASWPLAIAEDRWVGAVRYISFGAGLLAISLGVFIMYEVSGTLTT